MCEAILLGELLIVAGCVIASAISPREGPGIDASKHYFSKKSHASDIIPVIYVVSTQLRGGFAVSVAVNCCVHRDHLATSHKVTW